MIDRYLINISHLTPCGHYIYFFQCLALTKLIQLYRNFKVSPSLMLPQHLNSTRPVPTMRYGAMFRY